MSRITKEIAKYVAGKLTDKKQTEINKLHKSFEENAFNAYLKKIPKDVLECFNKHKRYFETTTQLKMVGNGWNYEYISIGKELPSMNGSYPTPQFDEKTSQVLLKEYQKINELKAKLKPLKEEIETALIRLGTFKKVEIEFKEAYTHLPKTVSQSLVVNVDKIREKLQ